MDSLLQEFKQFEIPANQVFGGYIDQGSTIVGGSQNGGDSYVDLRRADGSVKCDVLVSHNDSSNWINNLPM